MAVTYGGEGNLEGYYHAGVVIVRLAGKGLHAASVEVHVAFPTLHQVWVDLSMTVGQRS